MGRPNLFAHSLPSHVDDVFFDTLLHVHGALGRLARWVPALIQLRLRGTGHWDFHAAVLHGVINAVRTAAPAPPWESDAAVGCRSACAADAILLIASFQNKTFGVVFEVSGSIERPKLPPPKATFTSKTTPKDQRDTIIASVPHRLDGFVPGSVAQPLHQRSGSLNRLPPHRLVGYHSG